MAGLRGESEMESSVEPCSAGGFSTPATSTRSGAKRDLSSPLDMQEPKRVTLTSPRIIASTEDGCTSEVQSDVDPGRSMNINLRQEDLITISRFLQDSFRKDIHGALQADMPGLIKTVVEPIVDGVLSGLQSRMDALESVNQSLRHDNMELRSRITKLEEQMDEAEQYSRRNCLRITGIPEKADENTDDVVVEIGSAINVQLTRNDISRSHRVGRQPGGPKGRAIIVRFTSYRSRNSFYKARTGLRSSGYPGVYINEDLTKLRNTVLYQARQLVRIKKLSGAWSSDGRIFIKDNDGKVSQITSESDLVRFN